MDFRSYALAVYAHAAPMTMLAAPHEDERLALALACLRVVLTAGLALWAVLHLKLPRALRWPSHLEGSMQPVRKLQSGHPGDYVAWLTFGVAIFGAAAFWLGL
jgi:multicomponent Na+:H+ antiporter subunit D